jgi:plasmid stabilization system protein ParE
MSRRVVWSDDALDDLEEILRYFEDSEYALWLVDQLEAAGDRLGEVLSGRPGRVAGTFEKPVQRIRYILVFSFDRGSQDSEITIVRAIHMSRNWPKGQWPAD